MLAGLFRAAQATVPGLLLGLSIGALSGTVAGWKYARAGFPRAFAVEVVEHATLGSFATLAFFLLYRASYWSARRLRLPPLAADLLACAAACIPFFLFAGYEVNRRAGTTLSAFFSPGALRRNVILLAILLAVYLAVLVSIRGWRGARDTLPFLQLPRPHALLLVGPALVFLINGAISTAFRSSSQDAAPVVLLLVVDSLRADHLGCHGYGRNTTPEIDALARDSVLFRQAISQGTYTKTSIASLLTGRLPHQHGVFGDKGKQTVGVLPAAERTLPELLQERGFLTAAWIKNPHLRRSTGFNQGFVAFHENQRSIESIHRAFLGWLPRVSARTPFFAYLHYLDLHDPYKPRPPFDTLFGHGGDPYAELDLPRWGAVLREIESGRLALTPERTERMKALYDGQIRYVDGEIGHLLRELKRRGMYDRALIVLTADHGDGFMEHGFLSHGRAPYEELVRVPLLVKLPGSRHAGREVGGQVRLIDVLPTVLEEMGAEPPRRAEGCSLLGLLDPGPTREEAGCFTYALSAHGTSPSAVWISARTERHKYIYHPDKGGLFFDLAADPKERHDLSGTPGPALEHLRSKALAVAGLRLKEDRMRQELDPETIRELKALGYIQ